VSPPSARGRTWSSSTRQVEPQVPPPSSGCRQRSPSRRRSRCRASTVVGAVVGAGHRRGHRPGVGARRPTGHGPCSRLLEMARIPRALLVAEGSTNHCTWRSHGHAAVLDGDAARELLLALLRKYKEKFGIEIHSYCLMGTHPHVLCRSRFGQRAFSEFWKRVNWAFARWSNLRTGGRGQVVMERLRSPRIQDGHHQLTVMRYGDLNPVRAGLVRSPAHWRWSSYRHYALGEANDLITDAPEYLALGPTSPARRKAYRHLFATALCRADRQRRHDLVHAPFFGDSAWVSLRHAASGIPPPD